LDRDRVVDETGNQTVVFGRRGSRPFHLDEMEKFYRHEDGSVYKVQDVATVNGKLEARNGGGLQTPAPFESTPEPAPSYTPQDRLVRRGN
jgi:hypothetical protein